MYWASIIMSLNQNETISDKDDALINTIATEFM
jgi:hypothetical protein